MTRITPEQIEEAAEVLERLRRDLKAVYELDKRVASGEQPDGYRTSVRPMEGSPSATDDEGEPLPPHSDSTGQTVVRLIDGGGHTDRVRTEVRTMNDAFATLLKEAHRADGARDRALAPDKKASTAPPGCRVHEGYDLGWEPVHASERCRWCYDFQRVQGLDPPMQLLEARSKGRRISEAMVAAALAQHRHSARARKRRRKAS